MKTPQLFGKRREKYQSDNHRKVFSLVDLIHTCSNQSTFIWLLWAPWQKNHPEIILLGMLSCLWQQKPGGKRRKKLFFIQKVKSESTIELSAILPCFNSNNEHYLPNILIFACKRASMASFARSLQYSTLSSTSIYKYTSQGSPLQLARFASRLTVSYGAESPSSADDGCWEIIPSRRSSSCGLEIVFTGK